MEPRDHRASEESQLRSPTGLSPSRDASQDRTAALNRSGDEGEQQETLTRTDRYRRRVANHPIGSILILSVLTLGGVGTAIGGVQAVLGLFDGNPPAQIASSPAARSESGDLAPTELKIARNWRYGFTINYPGRVDSQ